ncbi:RNA ligase [Archaeoglobus veneficus]|uniref:Y414 protein n=1 Tax=Archaeoglobus veneficus (strain DSM 11195 / SNP6) TaxID=693661 RepID=F2KP76_ARCVS|nr:RNA ligase [Archaeoglobus veneficus]AEA47480.1 Y414 protein [Archaeoglobus veneficus SNP6]
MKFVAQALGLSEPAARKLEDRNILREAVIKHPFFADIIEAYNLEKKFGAYEEGTLIAKTNNSLEVIRGYPKIRRALVLYPTLKKHFKGEVAIEEKMNGYNVRIVKMGSNLYAVTRRGFICPYTTEKARLVFEMDFFRDNPHLMLCCEAVGDESPFVPKDIYGSGVHFYVFDIRVKKTNEPLGVREKEKVAEEYGFRLAPILEFADVKRAHEAVIEAVEKLGRQGREGVVIKDVSMKRPPVKYTTSQSNCSDLSYAFRYFNEYARDFMISRIVREAFQSFEFKESEEEFRQRCLRLGESILRPMVESIRDVKEKGRVAEKSKLRFYNLEVFELFKEHLRRMGVDARFSEPAEDNGSYIVFMERYMMSTTDKISNLLKGGFW